MHQTLFSETLQLTLSVKNKLGEGGQGEVWRVANGNHDYALKWYHPDRATAEQQDSIRYLVRQGPPQGAAGQRFIWPLDLVKADSGTQFGYLMPLIDTRRFAELGEVQARLKPSPGLPALCEISYQMANSYRALHLSGHCYRDISAGNLMFDPKTGDVLICDNDNVGVNNQSKSQIWGTMEYMAPEVVRDEADPSTATDLHSLAVLLFNLWVWHHPFHGELEYQIKCWDIPAKKKIYGENPVFVFDPANKANALPNDPEYDSARKRWQLVPEAVQALFTRAFTTGLHHAHQRVTEGEWQRAFLQLKDGVLGCPKCRAENLWSVGQSALTCWHCRTALAVPPKLVMQHPGGPHTVLLSLDSYLYPRHVQPGTEDRAPIGQVVQNPQNPQIWGIRNLTNTPWTVSFPTGEVKEVAPQRAAPLHEEMRLNIGGVVGVLKV